MLRLGAVPIDTPLVLAPMAGVTDRDFRLIVRRIGGVGLVTMEFIASRALVRGVARAAAVARRWGSRRPWGRGGSWRGLDNASADPLSDGHGDGVT